MSSESDVQLSVARRQFIHPLGNVWVWIISYTTFGFRKHAFLFHKLAEFLLLPRDQVIPKLWRITWAEATLGRTVTLEDPTLDSTVSKWLPETLFVSEEGIQAFVVNTNLFHERKQPFMEWLFGRILPSLDSNYHLSDLKQQAMEDLNETLLDPQLTRDDLHKVKQMIGRLRRTKFPFRQRPSLKSVYKTGKYRFTSSLP